MSDEQDYQGGDVEAPYSATFRTSPGYEAALLTVRGNDVDEFLERVDALTKAEGIQVVVDTNNLLQAAAVLAAPEQEEKPKSSGRGASSSRSSSGGGGARRGGGSSNRGASRRSEPADDEQEFHPDGLTCDKRGCDGRVHFKEIDARGKHYELWVCEFQRQRDDGHYSEFIN